MEERNIARNQKGFTLIEIIAVLVILGILAAVAVPKYMDMTANANLKAVDGAKAAAASNVTMEFSRMLLASGTQPTTANLITNLSAAANGYTTVGDFTAAYADEGNATVGVTITISNPPAGVTIAPNTDTKDVILVE